VDADRRKKIDGLYKEARKLSGKIDQAYLDNLKNGIRYWDGREWRKEWAMVKHSVVDGHQTVVHR
jgi:hypothetical protein